VCFTLADGVKQPDHRFVEAKLLKYLIIYRIYVI